MQARLAQRRPADPWAARDRRQATMGMSRLALLIGALLFAATGALAAESGGRVLTTSDVVAIRIVDHPELDTTTRIEPDGTINFPYVGRIKAAGRTEDDLARADRAAAGRIENPCRACDLGQRPGGPRARRVHSDAKESNHIINLALKLTPLRPICTSVQRLSWMNTNKKRPEPKCFAHTIPIAPAAPSPLIVNDLCAQLRRSIATAFLASAPPSLTGCAPSSAHRARRSALR